MKIKKICFLAGTYPTLTEPKSAVFYQNFVHQVAKMDIECRVIHPYPVNIQKPNTEKERVDIVDNEHHIKVYRPNCITLGAKRIGFWNTAYTSACLYTESSKGVLKRIDWKPDVFYGHFISPAGVMAAKLSQETGIPAFVAYGESQPWSITTIGVQRCKKILSSVNGFISVSSKNKKDLIDLNIADDKKVGIFPNSINNKVFYKRDKMEARRKFVWDNDKFIVAFVGHFNDRKGILRLDEAISTIPDAYVAYAGSGELMPKTSNTIYVGNVVPDLMPWFLSAADIFVLPTLNEGCCNAIIEALACGLPVVSSNREFNYDMLSDDNALLVEPESIQDIRSAIIKLMNSPELRSSLSERSIETVKHSSIVERCNNIINWMETKC